MTILIRNPKYDQLNNSHSKAQYPFPKEERFKFLYNFSENKISTYQKDRSSLNKTLGTIGKE